ncbi:diaminopimelate decarboxylase [Lutibacter sp. B1]|uniref:diaminopimelate decarboxylase n=1 Tax=Lutibacter sp. B1 TaxID=2725996 RepID=UPI00145717F8|nr:diaminopimelate decarboxylase [Lutibacter sp. B1]NLP58684.1 diaminopimelate decarboxylase [Lutibacter sp. B1]
MNKKIYERPILRKVVEGMPNKFGSMKRIRPINTIDNVLIDDIIDSYGSPVFILSEKTIRDTYKSAYRAFSNRYPKVQFAWSYKTNYLDAVCRIFHSEGSWAEVVSGFEYEKALANHVPCNKIIFNGPDKSKNDLVKAIQNKSLIHIDHFDELYTIIQLTDELNERPQVAIRVNMDTGIYPQWDRFGFNYENGEAWNAINRILTNSKIDLIGLHTHIGTYITVSKAYAIAIEKLASLANKTFERFKTTIKYIDVGGGFASQNTLQGAYLPATDTTPSFDDYAHAITTALTSVNFPNNEVPTLILETGRALIDEAGWLAGTVLANKRLADGHRAMVLDVGVNIMFTAFWYDYEIHPVNESSFQSEPTTMYGPLCMNIDVIRKNIDFPLLNKDDRFVIKRVGAYTMTQWMQFITYRPNVVLIDEKGKLHLIRKGEDKEVFRKQEIVPKHLLEKAELKN